MGPTYSPPQHIISTAMKIAAFAAASATAFASVRATTYFSEDFNNGDISNWVSAGRDGLGEFKLSPGKFFLDEEDLGLQTTEDAKFYGIASKFSEPFDNTDDTLVVQLSVKHEQNIDCGGGYVKVYGPSDDLDLATLDGDSPYNIMFGPDICGSKKMVHVIFSNKGENHLIKKSIRPPSDVFSHTYTLIVSKDNTYQVLIDNEEVATGSLEDDWDMLAAKKIKDPEASKPADWVDDKMIDDAADQKPDDWDSIPEEIEDADAVKPEDWDDDMDGEWAVPTIPNPEYKGEWSPARIENPDYKGPWEHPMVDNPEWKADPSLYAFTSGAIGVDIWQVKSGTIFDDILVTNSVDEAKEAAKKVIARNEAETKAKEEDDERVAAENKIKAEEMAENDDSFEDEDDDLEAVDDNDEL